jgi:IS5 family transposase
MTHSVAATAANVADIEKAAELIRKDGRVVYGDSGFTGLEKREEIQGLVKREEMPGNEKREEMPGNEKPPGIVFQINGKKGAQKKLENKIYGDPMNHLDYIGQPQWEKIIEYSKPKVRSKAGHMFGIVKGLFGFRKARYRGIKKNLAKLNMLESKRESGAIYVGGLPVLEKYVRDRVGVSPVPSRG